MERSIIDTCCCEVLAVVRVVPIWRKIRCDISVVGCDRNRRCEIQLLPARCGFSTESSRAQQRPAGRPQMTCMNTCIARALVKTDPTDEAIDVGPELHA